MMLSTDERTMNRWWDHYISTVAEFPKTIKSPLTLPRIFKLKDEIWADDDFWAALVAWGIERYMPEEMARLPITDGRYENVLDAFTAGLLAAYTYVEATQADFDAMMAVTAVPTKQVSFAKMMGLI